MSCTIIGCSNKYYAKGYCQVHYDNARRRGNPTAFPVYDKNLPCVIDGCGSARWCLQLCGKHYRAKRRKESPELRAKEVEWTRRWKAANVEKHAAQQSRYRRNNRAALAAYFKEWRTENDAAFKAYVKARKKHVRHATPPWADMIAIAAFYRNCPPGHHVDHIVPLRGKRVSGLHILENLQYLSAADNLKKSNRF